jgi:hypothetical protein
MQLVTIQQKIYHVRGHKILLDYDLAELYQVETRVLNQAVKRNIRRFPENFIFRLTVEEWKQVSSSQFVITCLNKKEPKTLTLCLSGINPENQPVKCLVLK